MAIERERHERSLRAALDRHQVLLDEMNHRVKNSLMIVSSMLQLQASEVGDAVLTQHLTEAAQRVTAIGQVHDQLSHGSDVERMDIGRYIEAVCKDLDASVPQCAVRSEVQPGIEVASDRAISTALIVNELIANAAKYASPGRPAARSACGFQPRTTTRCDLGARRGRGASGRFRSRPAEGPWHADRHGVRRPARRHAGRSHPTIRAPSSSSRSRARRRAERARVFYKHMFMVFRTASFQLAHTRM
jgi:two-component sensor histidine kinase